IRQARGVGELLDLVEDVRCRTAEVIEGADRGRLSRADDRRGAERARGEGGGGGAAPCALARGSGLDVHSGWCLPVLVAKYFGLASLVLPIPAPRAVGGQRLHDCCLVWFTISARHEKLEKTIKFFWLPPGPDARSEEHTSELQSRFDLVCRLLLEKKKNQQQL